MRVLIVSYSFSNQTRKIVRAVKEGLLEEGGLPLKGIGSAQAGAGHSGQEEPCRIKVRHIRLEPDPPLEFPFGTYARTAVMMVKTFFRMRVPIAPLPGRSQFDHDMVILAGPTWSYNPSGPILSFLDRYAEDFLYGKPVLAVISCRGYWRVHWAYLKWRIRRAGGRPLGPWVFTHPAKEPWRTIGVFLTVAGRHPRRLSFMKKRYRRYGHSRRQIDRAREAARELAREMKKEAAGLGGGGVGRIDGLFADRKAGPRIF